ncbi:MAG TPA: A/G-specific adenine glycosylase [Longimicrobiales bacterium]|nr:A/G-specific adenine glycosylase [Longimicrobiales bacterium]
MTDATNPARPLERKRLRTALLDFFDARARPLPWRDTDDPYAIWVSEIMLQQTRVETVIPYWERWMARYPDVEALATADESEVLKAWEGLGYYSRARNLREGAAVVRDRFGGEVPATVDELREVPGIGPYTAGAVASIAFGVATPAVDGNVRRVLARLFDEPNPTAAWLRDRASELVDPDRPGDFNQALMELGATVCTPSSPNCAGCPVAPMCAALSAGTVDERPAPKRRKPVPERDIVVIAACAEMSDGWRVAMRRRPTDGLLGGMWEFPEWEHDHDPPRADALPEVGHVFSHFRATYRPFVMEVVPEPSTDRAADIAEDIPVRPPLGSPLLGPDGAEPDEPRWIHSAEFGDLALPVAQRKIAGFVRDWLAGRGFAS